MDLDVSLWIGGMIFTLGVFATKVGLGLGFGGLRWRGVLATHLVYIALFLLAAVLADTLTAALRPVLRAGPLIHSLVASMMIGWGVFILRGSHRHRTEKTTRHALLLLAPCPVCFSAVVFSTWTALEITDAPPLLVGAGLGVAFVLLTSVLHVSVRLKRGEGSADSSRVALGLTMMAVGAYFLASLVLPAKIQQAASVYESFLGDNGTLGPAEGSGVLILLLLVMAAGYLASRKRAEAAHE